MNFVFEERPSNSPFVKAIWRTESAGTGTFISTAETHWEMVVTKYQGKTTFTMRGPETTARPAPVPPNAEFLGIVFTFGTFMPHLPGDKLVNEEVNLPEANSQRVWLHGSAWEIPDFENVDTFVAKLAREGLLIREPVVEAVLKNRPLAMSLRTVQRRFLRATGLTCGAFAQIERARQAATFLEQGFSIADAVYQAGYADQPHLTRSLKRFMGQTPAQIIRINESR